MLGKENYVTIIFKKRRENPKYENGFLTLGYGYLGNDEKKIFSLLYHFVTFYYLQ